MTLFTQNNGPVRLRKKTPNEIMVINVLNVLSQFMLKVKVMLTVNSRLFSLLTAQ